MNEIYISGLSLLSQFLRKLRADFQLPTSHCRHRKSLTAFVKIAISRKFSQLAEINDAGLLNNFMQLRTDFFTFYFQLFPF
ncbi:MAG: hypothetical protein DRI57_05130 [Deltaproteobacteria bacterium]|nr:MAG: hypothetical protein DRI57_05130 [Deltaproteobacteria bacterium]